MASPAVQSPGIRSVRPPTHKHTHTHSHTHIRADGGAQDRADAEPAAVDNAVRGGAPSSDVCGLPCSLLGRMYPPNLSGYESMLADARELMWFTYRRGIPSPAFSGDSGWGCTLRSMQMLLANALMRAGMAAPPTLEAGAWREGLTSAIARLFVDWPDAPFGLPRVVEHGGHSRWYGPHEASHAFVRALRGRKGPPPEIVSNGPPAAEVEMAIVACRDAALYVDELQQAATASPSQHDPADESSAASTPAGAQWRRPVLALVPLRLGVRTVNKAYLPSLVAATRLSAFAGAVGGTPRHSLYFTGVTPQGYTKKAWQRSLGLYTGPASVDTLVCLDPHTTQSCPRQDLCGALAIPSAISLKTMDGDSKPYADLPDNIAVVSLPLPQCSASSAPTRSTVEFGNSEDLSSRSRETEEWTTFLQTLAAPSIPKFMPPTALDPTISLAFMFHDADELAQFRLQLQAIHGSLNGADGVQVSLPLFDVQDTAPCFGDSDIMELSADGDDDNVAVLGTGSTPDAERSPPLSARDGMTASSSSAPHSRARPSMDGLEAYVQIDALPATPVPPTAAPAASATPAESMRSAQSPGRASDGVSEDDSCASTASPTAWYMVPSGLKDLLLSMWWQRSDGGDPQAGSARADCNMAQAAAASTSPRGPPGPPAAPAMRASSAPVSGSGRSPSLDARRTSSSSPVDGTPQGLHKLQRNRESSITEVVWNCAAAGSPEFRAVDAEVLGDSIMGADTLQLPPPMDASFVLTSPPAATPQPSSNSSGDSVRA